MENRILPSVKAICDWWGKDTRCFKCNSTDNLEKCHIIDACQGGIHHESNLNLLCHTCHRFSENIKEKNIDYFLWLSLPAHVIDMKKVDFNEKQIELFKILNELESARKIVQELYQNRKILQRIGIENAKKKNGGKCPWGGLAAGRRPNQNLHNQIIDLHKNGISIRKIAKSIPCSPSTVQTIIKNIEKNR